MAEKILHGFLLTHFIHIMSHLFHLEAIVPKLSKACEYVFNFQPNPFQLLCLKFKFAVIGATKLHVLLIFFIPMIEVTKRLTVMQCSVVR